MLSTWCSFSRLAECKDYNKVIEGFCRDFKGSPGDPGSDTAGQSLQAASNSNVWTCGTEARASVEAPEERGASTCGAETIGSMQTHLTERPRGWDEQVCRGRAVQTFQSQHPTVCPSAWHGALGLTACLAGGWFCFGLDHASLFSYPYFLGHRNVYPGLVPPSCLGGMQPSFGFLQGLTNDFSLSFRGDLGLGLLSKGGTVKDFGNSWGGLNTFCIVRWTWTFGGQGWNAIVWMFSVPQNLMC